jgi:hypothetical protein
LNLFQHQIEPNDDKDHLNIYIFLSIINNL